MCLIEFEAVYVRAWMRKQMGRVNNRDQKTTFTSSTCYVYMKLGRFAFHSVLVGSQLLEHRITIQVIVRIIVPWFKAGFRHSWNNIFFVLRFSFMFVPLKKETTRAALKKILPMSGIYIKNDLNMNAQLQTNKVTENDLLQ